LRAAVTTEAARERLQALFATQVAPRLVALSGLPRADALARAGLIASQILGLALCRYVLKLPPVVKLPRDEVVRRVGGVVQGYLFDA
jgi:hypothetical protein